MQIVEASGDVRVLDPAGRFAYALRRGERYVLYDQEAALALRDGAVAWVGTLGAALPPYRGQPLEGRRLLLPFIGRLGDALVTGSCLAALQERFPDVGIDVSCLEGAREVFELMPAFGDRLPYPVAVGQLGNYDYCLSFEDVEAMREATARSCGDVFSECLRTPRPARPVTLTVPEASRRRWRLPATASPRVAIHVGRPGSLRTYPADLCRELALSLRAAGCDIFLFGDRSSSGGSCERSEPTGASSYSSLASLAGADGILDFVGKTPTVADLAAVLEQMHVVVTGDSFPVHLAGVLRVPLVALFTSTDAVLASDYGDGTALQSRAPCSPCRISEGACPLGHDECVAHRHDSLAPPAVAREVAAKLARRAAVSASAAG